MKKLYTVVLFITFSIFLISCGEETNDNTDLMGLFLLSSDTLTNQAGTGTDTSTDTIAAPGGLSYSASTVSGTTGVAIDALNPTLNTGTATSWSVSPDLPAGLSLDSSTGILSGTPSETSSATDYTITATNSSGSTTATVNITVDPTGIVLFNAANGTTGFTGNLGGRDGADAKCAAEKPSGLTTCTRVRALLSVTSSDTIAQMPENFGVPSGIPVYANSLSGTKLYTTWSGTGHGALAYNIATGSTPTLAYGTLQDVSLLPTSHSGLYVLTGATAGGGLSASNCSNWSTTSGSVEPLDGSSGGLETTTEGGSCDGHDEGGVELWSILCLCY